MEEADFKVGDDPIVDKPASCVRPCSFESVFQIRESHLPVLSFSMHPCSPLELSASSVIEGRYHRRLRLKHAGMFQHLIER